jgi:transitional endoplasmic reticulum ATPase
LIGYSNADIEAVILLANEDAARESGGDAPVLASHFQRAAIDYFPSRDVELLEYMELLAVFESSSRSSPSREVRLSHPRRPRRSPPSSPRNRRHAPLRV